MKKQKKKLDFRKIEITDLSTLMKISGGVTNTNDGDGDLTSFMSTRDCDNLSTVDCSPPDGN